MNATIPKDFVAVHSTLFTKIHLHTHINEDRDQSQPSTRSAVIGRGPCL